MRRSAFTLIELLVALGILAVLAALLFPVFARLREAPRQTTCLSNIRQLGSACRLYLSDWDETHPLLWWAGATSPYVKNTDIYRCPNDPTRSQSDQGTTAYPLSYTRNFNLLNHLHDAQVTAAAQTVLLFEVSGVTVQLLDATEGVRSDTVGPQQFSGGGTGLDCDLVTTGPTTRDPYPKAQYATGQLDNASPVDVCSPSQFETASGRHKQGANFLAVDTHARWLLGRQVSAGYSALTPTAAQSRSGCAYHGTPPLPNQPCAEGTQNGNHRLTFSVN